MLSTAQHTLLSSHSSGVCGFEKGLRMTNSKSKAPATRATSIAHQQQGQKQQR